MPGDLTGVVAALRAAGCVFAEEEAAVLAQRATTAGELDDLVSRRVAGEPLEQVVGWADFAGVRVTMAPGVFVPRRRTELMVRVGLEALSDAGPAQGTGVVDVLDLCCGSGAIGAALLHHATEAGTPLRLTATDLDPRAVDCARLNVPSAAVLQGDLFEPLPTTLHRAFALICANVPYVPTGDIDLLPHEAREHEPVASLDGGVDGLAVLGRVAHHAPTWLRPRGTLLCEVAERQAPGAAGLLDSCGLDVTQVQDPETDTSVLVARAGTRC